METTVYPHAWLHNGSRFFLERAKATEEGRFYNLLASNLLSAFCFEAYLNHLGLEIVKDWNAKERKRSFKGRLDLICKEIGCSIEDEEPPFKTVLELFEFRDDIVHAKPTTFMRVVEELSGGPEAWIVSTEMQQKYGLSTTLRNFEDVTQAILELHECSGHSEDENPFLITLISVFRVPPAQGDS